MDRQILRMKYHPAKKEVTFSRVNGKKEELITGNSGSVLSKYINKKGQFVIQDHGNQFFKDILEAFDGEEIVNLEVTMTGRDYEDFVQMVDYFNKSSDIKITVTLLAELPNMDATYEAVKQHGHDSVNILNKNRDAFHDVDSDNKNVHLCVENFSKEINEATKAILDKINTLEQNSVNVCFSGPYSSGKSLLIDSLIGYAILPTDIRPETAAMFTICSPKKGENVRIDFNISDADNLFSELSWNEDENMFVFVTGPSESKTRKTIQETVNACKHKRQFEQIRDILDVLNQNEFVERVINVYFPIGIDNDKVQFTIYDTPGTDSGVTEHKNILKDALSEQTHSILVFVTYPNGLDGGGNKTLLEYLSEEIESKESKSTIDLGRSLFVINYADSLTDDDDFEALRTGKISNRKDVQESDKKNESGNKIITIKLSNQKVFFTTAKYAYPAVAAKNGVETKGDQKLLKSGSAEDVMTDELGKYYKQNRCATSERATELLIDKCETEFENANEKNDVPGMLWVASGLYALQSEIMEYGEKYASAVKAYSIIDSVDKALARLNRNAKSIEKENSQNIKEIEDEINRIRGAISDGISAAKKGREIGGNDSFPDEVVTELHLDANSITNFVQLPADKKVDEILLGFWQKAGQKIASWAGQDYDPSETTWDSGKQSSIEQAIDNVLSDYTDYFKKVRQRLLEKLRDDFIDEVKKSIEQNGEISDDAKSYILEIDTPEVEEFSETYKFGELYKQKKRTKKILWIDREYLDRESFIKDMNSKLRKVTAKLADNYRDNYRNSLNNLLRKVESEFNLNMEKYSVTLRAKFEDKEAMEALKDRILNAVSELENCQEKLNSVIWEVK